MTRVFLIALGVSVALGGVARASDPVNAGVEKARALVAAGEIEEGLSVLRALASKYPDDRLPHWWLANLLHQEGGRNREAAEVIADFLEQHPDDEYALRLLKSIARHSLESGDARVTRWCIEYLLRFEPNEKDNFYLAARASYRLGDRPSTIVACRELISRWPSYADAHRLLARVYADDGRFDLAADSYRALIEEKPGLALARLLLANLLRRDFRDYDAAEAVFGDALDASDPGTPDYREAERGIAQTRADRALAARLREQRRWLENLILVLLAVSTVSLGIAVFLTRPRG